MGYRFEQPGVNTYDVLCDIRLNSGHEKTLSPVAYSKTLLAFKPEPGQMPSFLRWGISSRRLKPKEKPAWWIYVKLDGG